MMRVIIRMLLIVLMMMVIMFGLDFLLLLLLLDVDVDVVVEVGNVVDVVWNEVQVLFVMVVLVLVMLLVMVCQNWGLLDWQVVIVVVMVIQLVFMMDRVVVMNGLKGMFVVVLFLVGVLIWVNWKLGELQLLLFLRFQSWIENDRLDLFLVMFIGGIQKMEFCDILFGIL